MPGTRPGAHPPGGGNTRTRQGVCDVNAPPKRSPKTPFAPSSPMVGGLFDLLRHGRYSAKSVMDEHPCTRSVHAVRNAQSGRRSPPPGPVRRPRGCRRRCPPAHWIQYSGPTHARAIEPSRRWPEKSARTGARPHSGSTTRRSVLAHGPQSRHPEQCPLTLGMRRTTLCLPVFSREAYS